MSSTYRIIFPSDFFVQKLWDDGYRSFAVRQSCDRTLRKSEHEETSWVSLKLGTTEYTASCDRCDKNYDAAQFKLKFKKTDGSSVSMPYLSLHNDDKSYDGYICVGVGLVYQWRANKLKNKEPMSLDLNQKLALHAPYCYLHSKEDCYPADINSFFIPKVSIKDKKGNTLALGCVVSILKGSNKEQAFLD